MQELNNQNDSNCIPNNLSFFNNSALLRNAINNISSCQGNINNNAFFNPFNPVPNTTMINNININNIPYFNNLNQGINANLTPNYNNLFLFNYIQSLINMNTNIN